MAKCPIWGTPCEYVSPSRTRYTHYVEGSHRAGGNYEVPMFFATDAQTVEDEVKARLTTWLIDQRQAGIGFPLVTTDEINQARQRRPLPAHERADRLLKLLVDGTQHFGETLTLAGMDDHTSDNALYELALAWSESILQRELWSLLTYLRDQGWVHEETDRIFIGQRSFSVTVNGHSRIEEQATITDSSLCFVAMWFDESIRNVYDNSIAPAIRDAGYEPLRIDQEPGLIDRIDDAITSGIRRSRFLVVDLTHGEEGARGSVYYEAGLAHGLDKPVVFMCREDKFNDIQRTFDTRQYNTIKWTDDNLEGLQKELTERILQSARIGRGTRYTE